MNARKRDWKGELADLLNFKIGLTSHEYSLIEEIEKSRKDGGNLGNGDKFTIHEIWDRRCG